VNPETFDCDYDTETDYCDEACIDGECVEIACSLGGFECDWPLGCKKVGPATLRCIPQDDMPEGFPCDDEVPGYRCASEMTCVWPSFETTSVCAYLCATSSDCAGVGLQGAHVCQPVPGSAYGWCR
jgi:hypothetical protein